MPKIEEILHEYKQPSLKERVLSYLQTHNDEVFSYDDLASLSMLVNHYGDRRAIMLSLMALYKQDLIGRLILGQRSYYGSKKAIAELIRRKQK